MVNKRRGEVDQHKTLIIRFMPKRWLVLVYDEGRASFKYALYCQ